MDDYGKELILDLHDCNPATFTRESIEKFFAELCVQIDMEREDLHWWDDEGLPPEKCQTEPHLKGVSAVQFIKTSNITIHTLELLKAAYLNIFSCKDFDAGVAKRLAEEWFGGNSVTAFEIIRK
jgi:S-adenosylmethionine/arginine decarboxylase-like enzyme